VRRHERRKDRPRCGARTRAGGSCMVRVEPGKARCRFHGGLSTGPKTAAGRARIAEVQRRRWRAYRERIDSGRVFGAVRAGARVRASWGLTAGPSRRSGARTAPDAGQEPGPEDPVWSVSSQARHAAGFTAGCRPAQRQLRAELASRRYSAGDGGRTARGSAPPEFCQQYARARGRARHGVLDERNPDRLLRRHAAWPPSDHRRLSFATSTRGGARASGRRPDHCAAAHAGSHRGDSMSTAKIRPIGETGDGLALTAAVVYPQRYPGTFSRRPLIPVSD
jgi:hypothetical protein